MQLVKLTQIDDYERMSETTEIWVDPTAVLSVRAWKQAETGTLVTFNTASEIVYVVTESVEYVVGLINKATIGGPASKDNGIHYCGEPFQWTHPITGATS